MLSAPSVTQAIGFVNPSAFDNVPKETLELAKARGTEFHGLAASYAAGLWIYSVDPSLQGYFESFQRWFDRFVVKTIAVEQTWRHPTLYYHGTPDWIGVIRGDEGNTLADWKTPLYASKSWRLQLAGYKALAESQGIEITRVASVQPRKDGKQAKFLDYPKSLTRDLQVFMEVLDVWRFFNDKN